jgi:hypothetical protein
MRFELAGQSRRDGEHSEKQDGESHLSTPSKTADAHEKRHCSLPALVALRGAWPLDRSVICSRQADRIIARVFARSNRNPVADIRRSS